MSVQYEFGSATEDRTLVMGLRTSQTAILASGFTVAVGLARAGGGSASSFGLAAVCVGVAAAVSLWPVSGHTLDEWIPVGVRWSMAFLRNRRRRFSALPLLGHNADGDAMEAPPDTLTGTRILVVPVEGSSGREIGVAHDRHAGTYTAVLSVRGRSFQLADTPDRQRRLASW